MLTTSMAPPPLLPPEEGADDSSSWALDSGATVVVPEGGDGDEGGLEPALKGFLILVRSTDFGFLNFFCHVVIFFTVVDCYKASFLVSR